MGPFWGIFGSEIFHFGLAVLGNLLVDCERIFEKLPDSVGVFPPFLFGKFGFMGFFGGLHFDGFAIFEKI